MFEFARLNRKKDATADRAVVHEGKRQSDADFEDMGDESPLFRCVSVGLVRFPLFWQEILTSNVVVPETDIQYESRFRTLLRFGNKTPSPSDDQFGVHIIWFGPAGIQINEVLRRPHLQSPCAKPPSLVLEAQSLRA